MAIELSTEQKEIVNSALQKYLQNNKYQEFIESLSGQDRSVIASWMYERNPKYLIKFNKILPDMFKGSSSLQNITLPTSIQEIGQSAFEQSSLTEIIIPASVASIEPFAFKNCQYLQKVTLPEGLRTIPVDCFGGCTRLKEVHLPFTVDIIAKDSFRDCPTTLRIFTPYDERVEKGIAIECWPNDEEYLKSVFRDSEDR